MLGTPPRSHGLSYSAGSGLQDNEQSREPFHSVSMMDTLHYARKGPSTVRTGPTSPQTCSRLPARSPRRPWLVQGQSFPKRDGTAVLLVMRVCRPVLPIQKHPEQTSRSLCLCCSGKPQKGIPRKQDAWASRLRSRWPLCGRRTAL